MRLSAREDVILGLLTGNYEPVARLKLARAGIGGHFARGQGMIRIHSHLRWQIEGDREPGDSLG